MKSVLLSSLIFSAAIFSGCTTAAPIGSMASVPVEQKTQCISICDKMDMNLGAFVVISNSTGCVCEPRGSKSIASNVRHGGIAVAGGAIIALAAAEEAERQRQQQQQQQRR